MKKTYQPIDLPMCRCGQQAEFINARKKFGVYNNSPIRKQLQKLDVYAPRLRIPQGHRYGYVCRNCGIVKSAGTKRMAMQAFEKAVEIHVDV